MGKYAYAAKAIAMQHGTMSRKVKIMGWSQYFSRTILERGYGYYRGGAVESMSVTDEKITATVAGTNDYTVEIDLCGDFITGMDCTCPYAEDGNYCKHMAAVLYKWSKGEDSDFFDGEYDEDFDDEYEDEAEYDDEYEYELRGGIAETNYNLDEISQLLAMASEAQVRDFLATAMQSDSTLLARFRTLVKPTITSGDMQRYKDQIDDIIDDFLGRDQFISYYDAADFIEAVEDYLDEDVKLLMDTGQYWSAFDLTRYLFAEVGNVDMDDSGGYGGMFANRCVQIMYDILDFADAETKDKIFKWMISKPAGGMMDHLEDQIDEVLMSHFKEEKYLEAKLDYTEKRAEKAVKAAEKRGTDYYASKWIMRHLLTMEALQKPSTEIEQYCKERWEYADVRKYYIQNCIEREDFDEAIAVLKESILLDEDYRGLVKDYSQTLKDIYRQTGNREAYRKQLWDLMLKDDAGSVDVYKELRGEYETEEWVHVREEIFSKLPTYAAIDQLYKEDELYDKLLDYVVNTPGLYKLQTHESLLKGIYPDALLEKYRMELRKMATRTANRKQYQEWVRLLKRMLKIKGGSKVVRQIVDEWKVQYKHRPAMMDELNKLLIP